MRHDVADWFVDRFSRAEDWPVERVVAAKRGTTVSIVLPALDEAATVGAIVETIRTSLVDVPEPVVDELVVIDSFSTDDTAGVAARAGARVVSLGDVLPHLPAVPGKGEALWRSLAATSADVVVFVDADLLAFEAATVTGLVGPLLDDPTLQLVKATYDRPLVDGSRVHPAGGGRVTELVARPLLNLHWPQLAGFVQPLAGEYAARRSLLERLPFPTGYGVELGLLVDALHLVGLSSLAQVDLGQRRHRHHDDQRLGRMAAEIWHTALSRIHRDGPGVPEDPTLVQFSRDGNTQLWQTYDVTALERPPMATVTDYVRVR